MDKKIPDINDPEFLIRTKFVHKLLKKAERYVSRGMYLEVEDVIIEMS